MLRGLGRPRRRGGPARAARRPPRVVRRQEQGLEHGLAVAAEGAVGVDDAEAGQQLRHPARLVVAVPQLPAVAAAPEVERAVVADGGVVPVAGGDAHHARALRRA